MTQARRRKSRKSYISGYHDTPSQYHWHDIYVYTGMYWVYPGTYSVFAKARTSKSSFVTPSIYFLLFINVLIHILLVNTVHCVLEPKVKKKYVQIMNFATPGLIILIHTSTSTYSYVVLVHTCTYAYIVIHAVMQHHVLRIRLELPCNDVLSLLHECAVHCSQHPLRSGWWSGLPGGACHAQNIHNHGLTS